MAEQPERGVSGAHKYYAGGGGSGPIPPPPGREVGERPGNVWFADLMVEPLRVWARAVAENFVWLAGQAHSLHTVEECWLDRDSALCARYRNSGGRFGVRFAELHISPISGPLSPTMREHDSGSAVQQASNLLDVQLGGGPPGRVEWIDDEGRGWWGKEPARGWPSVSDPQNRFTTIYPVTP